MSTVEVSVPAGTSIEHGPVQEIRLDQIQPFQANPRRRMEESALAELAANIQTHGLLQPILVRPTNTGSYEIVCGERRWRASKAAGKETIAARIVHLDDAEALEIAVIENVQRENIHELDEALGYRALIQQGPERYSVDILAATMGRSPAYIYGRLKLAELTPDVQTAFYAGKLTLGHAMEIARLQPKDQGLAIRECFPEQKTASAILKDKNPQLISVRDLRHWIEREIHLSLANAPFDVSDGNLVSASGPCTTCPKRSGANPLLFADSIRRKDVCTDRDCFRNKVAVLVQLRMEQAEAEGEKPVRVSDSHRFYGEHVQTGVIYRSDYHEATAPGECPSTVAAVVSEGKEAGRKRYVCTNQKCPVHAARGFDVTPEEKAERKKQREALILQQAYRKRLLEEIRKRVPTTLTRHELDLVALQFFQQLGHDNQHRICKFFAWEKKPKGGCGGNADYLKLAGAKLQAMTMAEVGRFLIVCALASDLYCPSYLSGGALSKDSKLVREAVHHKVNADRVLREVKEGIAKKSQHTRAKRTSGTPVRTGTDG